MARAGTELVTPAVRAPQKIWKAPAQVHSRGYGASAQHAGQMADDAVP